MSRLDWREDTRAYDLGPPVAEAFEREYKTLPLASIVPLKKLREGIQESKKYAQVTCSLRAIGLVEAPVVIAAPGNAGQYYLLDGHLRLEALKELGVETVACLVATDEETYTYNKRVNRLAPIQEHRMIVRAIERGVEPSQIAAALGLDVQTIRKRKRLLEGICQDAAELLKDANCPIAVFDILRRMTSIRQVEASDLMLGQNNFTALFAKALLAATPDDQLVTKRRKRKLDPGEAPSIEQLSRMENELAVLQSRIRSVEDNYGIDNLHLTLARGYICKLLGNGAIARWMAQNRQEYLGEFQRIAEIETLSSVLEPTMS
jgi:ParB-like chromosome segregation protein Spo0J